MKYLLDIRVLSESRRKSTNQGLEKWLLTVPNAALFTSWFDGRIPSLDFDTLNRLGIIRASYRTLPVSDSLLAATAVHHRLTLVTSNMKDFSDIADLQIINPLDD
jgi:predicted nucleic acid-binding protein